MKVLAVVVTHNRRELLSRCIDHLLAQTCAPESILVLNNASTDGTAEMLHERGIPFLTQENVGSAGGWHRGIEEALAQDFDAVWLMDDDGFPDEKALGILKSALRSGISCAASVVLRENQPSHFVFPFPILDNDGLPVLFRHPRKLATLSELSAISPDGRYPFAHLFNGALVAVTAIRKVGNVDRDFFMFGDEVDYFFRLRSAGAVVSVLGAAHYHPDVAQRPYTPAKAYYYLKNTLVLNTRYFNSVPVRHLAAIAAVLGRTARRNGVAAALSLLAGPNASAFYSGLLRGLQGKIGKDFNG